MKVPFLPPPHEDEPLDGWLGRIAAGIHSNRPAVLRHWEIPGDVQAVLIRDVDEVVIEALGRATGVDPVVLKRMTLDRWDVLGLKPPKDKRGHSGGVWTRGGGSRHCPDCLQDRAGAFRLEWFLHWSFACTKHEVLLTPTTRETHPFDLFSGMSTAQAVHLLPNRAVIDAQRFIDALLRRPESPTRSITAIRPAWEVFTDFGALVRMALAGPVWEQTMGTLDLLSEHTEEQWASLALHIPQMPADATVSKRFAMAVRHPAAVAVAATLAARVLMARSVDEAAEELWWTTPEARQEASYHARTRQFSWPLVRAFAASTSTRRQARSLLLTRFDLARYDEHRHRLSPLDPSKIPATCWPTVQLTRSHQDDGINGVAIAAALAMIATGRRAKGALDRLGLSHLKCRIETDWDVAFDASDDGDRNFAKILGLQRALVGARVPIDYTRRRNAFPRPQPLGTRARHRLEAAIERRLGPRESTFVAWYLWELLTGSDVLMADGPIDAHGTTRSAYRRQRYALREKNPDILLEIAEAELFRRRIDEPVTWSPIYKSGHWLTDVPGSPRLLDGWRTTSRRMRGPRTPKAGTSLGYDFEPAVALACRADTTDGRHLARNLRRFFAVAVEEHQGRAAKRLGVSQGTLSIQIRDLERSLAVTLFDRGPTGMSLQPEGKRLLQVLREQGKQLVADV